MQGLGIVLDMLATNGIMVWDMDLQNMLWSNDDKIQFIDFEPSRAALFVEQKAPCRRARRLHAELKDKAIEVADVIAFSNAVSCWAALQGSMLPLYLPKDFPAEEIKGQAIKLLEPRLKSKGEICLALCGVCSIWWMDLSNTHPDTHPLFTTFNYMLLREPSYYWPADCKLRHLFSERRSVDAKDSYLCETGFLVRQSSRAGPGDPKLRGMVYDTPGVSYPEESKPYSNKEHIGQYEIVKGATVQPGQSDDESEEDTDSEDDKDEEEEGGEGKKKIQKGKKSTLEQIKELQKQINILKKKSKKEKTLKKEKPREPKTRKEKQETQKEKTIKGGAEPTSKREREKGMQNAEEEPTVQTEEGQEQVDLTIVSTLASLSAVPKKGMGVLLESPRKGEGGTDEAKKGEGGSDSNKRKKVLLESP
eukprot:g42431.t1